MKPFINQTEHVLILSAVMSRGHATSEAHTGQGVTAPVALLHSSGSFAGSYVGYEEFLPAV